MASTDGRDGQDRLERLTNLVLFLLHASAPATIHEICTQVAGYPPDGDPAAMRQRFERDKRILRDEGIEIRVEPVQNESQLGYIIREEDFFLPELRLTTEEQAALGVAMTAVHMDESSSRDALSKLGITFAPLRPLAADLPAEPQLPALHEAVRARAEVSFRYNAGERAELRTVDPYGLLCRDGRWYIAGWDHTRSALRTFRLDRIEGELSMGEPGTFEPPAGFDPATAFPAEPWRIGDGVPVTVRVEIEAVLAPLVTASLGSGCVESCQEDGTIIVGLDVVNIDAFRAWVLGMGERARVLSPPEVVGAVVGWLRTVVAPR